MDALAGALEEDREEANNRYDSVKSALQVEENIADTEARRAADAERELQCQAVVNEETAASRDAAVREIEQFRKGKHSPEQEAHDTQSCVVPPY